MKPKRGSYARTISIGSGDSFAKISETLASQGVKPDEATFQVRESDNYGCNCWATTYSEDVELVYQVPESDEDWEARLVTYRKRLATWEEWSENHKEEIEARIAERAAEKDAKLTRSRERARKSLEKEEKTLEKRLENLKKRLQK